MKKLENRTSKILAIVLAAVLACGGTGILAHAAYRSGGSADKTASAAASPAAAASSAAGSTDAAAKEETVYVLTAADGTVKNVIVSDVLTNGGTGSLTDKTSLTDLKNVDGDETFAAGSDGTVVWDAQGGDIRCQGTSSAALPVSLHVSYTLDGQSVTAEELAGKSGHVVIRFDYTNNQYETAVIGGKQTKICVPFVVLTGMALDNSVCSHIEVSNGKLVDDGDRTFVAGFALPGMSESLDLSADTAKLPENVEISFDAKDFSLDTTVTLASNSLFTDTDSGDLDSELDDLSGSLTKLTDAMTALMDGSSDLYDGLCTLLEKSGELKSGVTQLADSLSKVEELRDGAAVLNTGLGTVSANSADLVSGARQTFASLLAMGDSQLAAAGVSAPTLTIDNYASVLEGLGASLSEADAYAMAYNSAYSAVSSGVNAQKDAIRAGVTAAVQAKTLEAVLAASGIVNTDGSAMTADQYQQAVSAGLIDSAVSAQVDAAVTSQMASAEVQAAIDSETNSQIQSRIDAMMASSTIQAQIEAGKQTALAGAGSLAKLKAGLDSYNTFYQGLLAYTAGVDASAKGAVTLAAGTAELYTKLSAGVSALQTGTNALTTGVTQLRDGSADLKTGLQELNDQGIQKILDALGGSSGQLADRLQAMVNASRNYTSFSGAAADTQSSVKFVFTTDSIGE